MTDEPPTYSGAPACWRHFFKGHKWWCRACDRKTEQEFRDLCWLWWRVSDEERVRLLEQMKFDQITQQMKER